MLFYRVAPPLAPNDPALPGIRRPFEPLRIGDYLLRFQESD